MPTFEPAELPTPEPSSNPSQMMTLQDGHPILMFHFPTRGPSEVSTPVPTFEPAELPTPEPSRNPSEVRSISGGRPSPKFYKPTRSPSNEDIIVTRGN